MYEVNSHVIYIIFQYNALLYVMNIIFLIKQGCLIDAGIKKGMHEKLSKNCRLLEMNLHSVA